MADAFSDYVTEWHGGRTRAYVNAYVESETDKTATVYVAGCVQATNITQYGVRITVTGGAEGSGVVACPSWTADYASANNRFTVDKGTGHYQLCECWMRGDTIDGYGPISGQGTATVNVWIGAKVMRPPSAPANLKAVRNAAASINLTWTTEASNATYTLVFRKQKGGDWVEIYDGAVKSSHTDSPGIGSFSYRVQNWNPDGYSGFSAETPYVVTLCAPAAPTLVSPASGSTFSAESKALSLTWRHNSIDSSAQSAAEIRYTSDNATWKTLSTTTAQWVSCPIAGNTSVQWQVKTKGAHADFSPYSAVSMFLVRTPPGATISMDNVITTVPISVKWTYDDATGTQSSATIKVLDNSNREVCKVAISGAAKARTITADEWTPKQGQTYHVWLTVVSTTSLSFTTGRTVTVNYTPPPVPSCALVINPDEASTRIVVYEGSGAVSTRSLSVFRDGVLVADNLLNNTSCTDKIPPLDCTVTYRVVAYAASGAVADCERKTVVDSRGYAYFTFGGDLCRLTLDMAYDDKSEGERVLRQVASAKYPKAFFGIHEDKSGNVSALMPTDGTVEGEKAKIGALKRLKTHNGQVYMRLPEGDAFDVVCDVEYALSCKNHNLAEVSIAWTAVTS